MWKDCVGFAAITTKVSAPGFGVYYVSTTEEKNLIFYTVAYCDASVLLF